MRALEILYQYKQADEAFGNSYSMGERLEKAIEELEAHIIVYQTIRNRLDNTVIALAVLQDENETLKKIIINTRNGD